MAFGTHNLINKANRQLQLSITSHFRKRVERLYKNTPYKVNKDALSKMKSYTSKEWALEKTKIRNASRNYELRTTALTFASIAIIAIVIYMLM